MQANLHFFKIFLVVLSIFIAGCIPAPVEQEESEETEIEFEDADEVAKEREQERQRRNRPIPTPAPQPVSLFAQAKSVFDSRCLTCHANAGSLGWGVDRNSNEQDWINRTPAGLIVPGNMDASKIVNRLIHYPNDTGRSNMPVNLNSDTFAKSEFQAVANWVYSLNPSNRDCGNTGHGMTQTRVRYRSSSVPFGGVCESELQTRTCNNGSFSSFSGTFSNSICNVSAPRSCGNIPHGGIDSRTRYQSASVPFGGTCMSEVQTRVCNNGSFSGFSGTFSQNSCVVQAAAGCGNLASGQQQSRTMYQTATVPFGSTCVSEIQRRTCVNGSFSSFSGTFQFNSCQVSQPASCGALADGQTQTRTMYQTATVPHGSSCRQETQTRTCLNGTLSAYNGSFVNSSCTVLPPADCGTVAHGETDSRMRYQTSSVSFGETCNSEMQSRTCNNGTLSNFSGTFTNATCTVDPAANCGGVAHGQTDSRTRYQAMVVGFGNSCVSETQSRTCNNGSFTNYNGSYQYDSCSVQPAMNCGSTRHGQSETRTMYQSSSVTAPASCVSETQTRTCNNGTFTNYSGSYTHSSCTVSGSSISTNGITLIQGSCLNCHGSGGFVAHHDIDFADADEFMNSKYYDADNPGNSLLLRRTIGHGDGNSTMPPGGTNWSQQHYDNLRAWVVGLTPPSRGVASSSPFSCDEAGNLPVTPSLKRLSKEEIRGTIYHLIWEIGGSNTWEGFISGAINLIPSDDGKYFKEEDNRINANSLIAYFDVANEMAHYMTENGNRCHGGLNGFLNSSAYNCLCNSSRNIQNMNRACFDTAFDQLSLKIFRKPATQQMRDAFYADYQAEVATETANHALRNFLSQMFQSNHFLFHTNEVGPAVSGRSGYHYLTPYELANKLSYFFWKRHPDQTLMNFAASGHLDHDATASEFNEVINHMITKDFGMPANKLSTTLAGNFSHAFKSFIDQNFHLSKVTGFGWMDNSWVQALRTDKGILPFRDHHDSNNFRQAQKDEVYDLFSYHMFTTNGTFSDVLTTDKYFTSDRTLASIYQVPPLTTEAFGSLDNTKYAGLLSRVFMNFNGKTSTNPITKGARIREEILCDVLTPPENVLTVEEQLVALAPPPGNHTISTVERFNDKVSDSTCMGCHTLINPLGNVFEVYAPTGQYRDTELTKWGSDFYNIPIPTDDLDPLIDSANPGNTVSNPIEFANELAQDGKAHACFAKKLFVYSHRRDGNNSVDQCVQEQIYLKSRNGNLLETFTEVVKHSSFKMRRLR